MRPFKSRKLVLFTFLLIGAATAFGAGDPLQRVALDLGAAIEASGHNKVAVFALPHHDNHPSDGPFVVSERLASYLARDKKVMLIERNHLLDVLEELHLSETGALDPASTKRIGEMLGADIIITGTLIDVADGKTEVNARGLLASNGRVVAASRCMIDRQWDERPRLEW